MALGDAFGFFTARGWSPSQSAGIVGNLMGESQLNPGAIGDGGRAYGIAQWHPDRQAKFEQIYNTPIRGSSLEQQLEFVDWELRNTESRAGNILSRQMTVEDATYAFGKYYERPADLSKSIGSRTNYAKKALSVGKDLLDKGVEFIRNDPFAGPILKGGLFISDGIGLTGECNWFCQFKNWIADSGFFTRVAIAILAFILIAAAVVYIGRGEVAKTVKGALT